MGIYYSVTVGVGFEVPLGAIQALPNYEENGGVAAETLDEFLYEYPDLSYTSAHAYDADDEETQFVICVNRLTETYSDYETFELVALDSTTPALTKEEASQVRLVQFILFGEYRPVVQFVASRMN